MGWHCLSSLLRAFPPSGCQMVMPAPKIQSLSLPRILTRLCTVLGSWRCFLQDYGADGNLCSLPASPHGTRCGIDRVRIQSVATTNVCGFCIISKVEHCKSNHCKWRTFVYTAHMYTHTPYCQKEGARFLCAPNCRYPVGFILVLSAWNLRTTSELKHSLGDRSVCRQHLNTDPEAT